MMNSAAERLSVEFRTGLAESAEQIRQILQPSLRYRLVDRVTDQGDMWLETTWTPPAESPWYRTDSDGRSLLLPGTIVTEMVVQSAELLIYGLQGGRSPTDGVPVLARLRKAAFRRMVAPGTPLWARVTLTHQLGPAFEIKAVVKDAEGKVWDGLLVFTATEAVRTLTRDH